MTYCIVPVQLPLDYTTQETVPFPAGDDGRANSKHINPSLKQGYALMRDETGTGLSLGRQPANSQGKEKDTPR